MLLFGFSHKKKSYLCPEIESVVFHSQVVAQGEIIEKRSLPPYYKIMPNNDLYRYRVKFLINRVFKGQSSLAGKVVSFDAYLYPESFNRLKARHKLVFAFAEVKSNLEATPLDFRLRDSVLEYDKILKFFSLSANEISKLEIWPIEDFLDRAEDVSELYYSDEVILGYFINKTLFSKKGKNLKDPIKFDLDESSDRYYVREFYVKRVLKGNKYFEGKIIKFVSYPVKISEFIEGSINKPVLPDCNPVLETNVLYLFSMKDPKMIDSSTNNDYSRIRAYDMCKTEIKELDPSKEQIIKMYFKRAAEPSYVPPPKPKDIEMRL